MLFFKKKITLLTNIYQYATVSNNSNFIIFQNIYYKTDRIYGGRISIDNLIFDNIRNIINNKKINRNNFQYIKIITGINPSLKIFYFINSLSFNNLISSIPSLGIVGGDTEHYNITEECKISNNEYKQLCDGNYNCPPFFR